MEEGKGNLSRMHTYGYIDIDLLYITKLQPFLSLLLPVEAQEKLRFPSTLIKKRRLIAFIESRKTALP